MLQLINMRKMHNTKTKCDTKKRKVSGQAGRYVEQLVQILQESHVDTLR